MSLCLRPSSFRYQSILHDCLPCSLLSRPNFRVLYYDIQRSINRARSSVVRASDYDCMQSYREVVRSIRTWRFFLSTRRPFCAVAPSSAYSEVSGWSVCHVMRPRVRFQSTSRFTFLLELEARATDMFVD